MEYALAWWVALEALGLIAIPYLFWVFPGLPDRGLAFSKLLGSLLLGYTFWILGTAQLLPSGRGAVLLACLLLAAGSLWLAQRAGPPLLEFLREARGTLFVYEAVFALAFFAWAFVRAHNPGIEGTEKPMEFAMLNSAMLSTAFPPNDPWLQGFSINYYYFGYLIMGALTYLSGVPSAIGFNLALAFLFAATAVGAWGLVATSAALMSRWSSPAFPRANHLFGGLAAFLVLLLGNLMGFFELIRAHGGGGQALWTWLSIKKDADPASGAWNLLGVLPNDAPYQSATWYPEEPWWWWRATRVIDTISNGQSTDYTITEFPAFSFLLGDLHPHVMALPFALLALALVLHVLVRPQEDGPYTPLRALREWLPLALVLGGLGFINGWDLGPYLALTMGAVALRSWHARGGLPDLRYLIVVGGLLGAGALLLFAPFYLPLAWHVLGSLAQPAESAAVQGFPIGWWSGPSTRPLHFLLLWAPLLLLVAPLLIVAARSGQRSLRILLGVALAFALLTLLLVEGAYTLGGPAEATRVTLAVLQRTWPFLISAALLAPLAVAAARRQDLTELPVFPLLLAGSAFLLLGFAESFHIKDVFGNRMNTVFKLSYQSWLWLSLAGALTAYHVWRTETPLLSRLPARLWTGSAALLLLLGAIYLPAAVMSKTNGLAGPATLDGQAYLRHTQPDELEALRWLQRQPDRRSGAVLEAVGPQYSFFARVSASTGIPSVLGWEGHELQWRGSDAAYRGRAEEVDAIYLAADKAEVTQLLNKYQVRYVYVGSLERSKYPPESLAAFQQLWPLVFQNDGVAIYRNPNA